MLDGDNAPPGNVEEARPKKHPSQHGWANTTENIFRGRKRAPASSVVVDDVSKIAFSLRISRNSAGRVQQTRTLRRGQTSRTAAPHKCRRTSSIRLLLDS